jgi:hypothetical protein
MNAEYHLSMMRRNGNEDPITFITKVMMSALCWLGFDHILRSVPSCSFLQTFHDFMVKWKELAGFQKENLCWENGYDIQEKKTGCR